MNSTQPRLPIVSRRTGDEIRATEALAELFDLAHRIQAASCGELDEIAAFIIARHQRPDLDRLLSAVPYRSASDRQADAGSDDDGFDAA